MRAGGGETVTLEAPAKVNAGLRVLGRRPDGYHDLETVIVPVSLCDMLTVHADAGAGFRTLSLSLEVGGDAEVAGRVPVDETNLVLRAPRARPPHAGVRGFAEFHLEKRIPAAAGLGGGSSDAAAALLALNQAWRLGLRARALLEVAAKVGSDVPALLARRPVRVSGRGERVALVPDAERPEFAYQMLLVTFDFGVSAADAFGWWDEDGGPSGPPERRLRDAWWNDQAGPVIARHPRIAEVMDLLMGRGASLRVMSGSGPTVLAGFGADARLPVEELGQLSGRRPMLVRPWNEEDTLTST